MKLDSILRTLFLSVLCVLPSCVLENRGGGQYVLRAKTGEEYKRESELKQKVAELSQPTGRAPSVLGKTYKVIPKGRMVAAKVKFLSAGRLTYTEDGYKGLKGASGQWKQDGNTLGFQVHVDSQPTYIGRIRGEKYEGIAGNKLGYAGDFTGVTGNALAARERAEEEQAHQELVKLYNQVEGFKQFWREAMTGGSSGGSDSGGQGSRSFTSSGKNDMTVTYDKLAGSAPTRGTNTIHVRLGSHAYSLTYDFYPGSYLLDGGGDLTGMTVNVKFEGGRPVTAKNYQRGDGYVKISSWQQM